MKTKIGYLIVLALLLASWAGNYAYNRYSQLPEAGFLRHFVETRTVPSVAFDLLYVANSADKRKIVGVQVDELPMLKFNPVQIHQELRHQRIYKLMGYFDDKSSWPADEPLKIHTVKAFYSDGSMKEEDVGEIVVIREAWPRAETEIPESPIQMSSTMGSSDHHGSATISIEKPVKFTGVSSIWLEKLEGLFEYKVQTTAEAGAPHPNRIDYPVELRSGQSLTLSYRFMLSRQSTQSLDVYNLQLRENFEDSKGESYGYTVFANYMPYPSESQMRAYVREQRRLVG